MPKSIFSVLSSEARKTIYYKMLVKAFIHKGELTIPELGKLLDLSVPTVTKILNELLEGGFVMEVGKRENTFGRLPVVYDLNPSSGYFVGVNPNHDSLDIAICDFRGECVTSKTITPFMMENNSACLKNLISHIKSYIANAPVPKEKIFHVAMNVSGRVNPFKGLSYSIFNFLEEPLADYLSSEIGYPTSIENDTRAMTYGEFLKGCCKDVKNVIFVNVSWGIAIGIIINGNLYFGKSGYSGEFGHVRAYDNEILCHCGKKGCLETEVSGKALLQKVTQRLKNGEQSILSKQMNDNNKELSLPDVLDAISKEDVLCIDVLQKIAAELGKNLAGIINIFNPDMLVIGGDLSLTGEYITQPVSMGIKKYSLNIVNEDSKITTSSLKENAGIIGACMVARYKTIES